MVRSDENNPTLFRPIHSSNKNNRIHGDLQAGGKLSMGGAGQNRRALSNINKNVIGVPPYPCAVNKRGLAEKHAVCQKSQPGPGHRPITRKFAAQLASRDETLPTECKKNSQLPSVSSASSDCIIIDAEDCIEINDDTVPMFVQHTEAVLEEIDKMEEEEIAMDDIERKSIVDIDSPDKKNPRAVVEYIDDLYKNYRKAESSGCASANYMEQQFDINERMRGILIDWLIEVHYKFELMEETLYLTINLIDRFLASQTVVRKKLQLVGVTAMLLACKYEEVIVPVMEDLILISDKAYTRKEVLDMEKLMLNTLQFNLSIPTPYVFMKRFLKAAESDKKLELVSFFLIELCLVEYEMLQFPPSLLAAAAVFTAQCTLTGSKQWSKTSERYTNYSKEQLFECSRMMVRFHQKAGMGKLTGVHRKYSLSKYGYAANSEPAHFLLEDRSYLIKANDDGC